jgi:hypothetical protein
VFAQKTCVQLQKTCVRPKNVRSTPKNVPSTPKNVRSTPKNVPSTPKRFFNSKTCVELQNLFKKTPTCHVSVLKVKKSHFAQKTPTYHVFQCLPPKNVRLPPKNVRSPPKNPELNQHQTCLKKHLPTMYLC